MFSNEVIINSIERYYPGIVDDVKTRLNEVIPLPENDLDKIPEIIDLFCEARFICKDKITGREIKFAYVKLRKELLAVILMFYKPEKLYGVSKERTKMGAIKRISEILSCSPEGLSNFIPEIIVHFRTYDTFNRSVTDTYNRIKNNLK